MKLKLIPVIFAFLLALSCNEKNDFPDTFKSEINFGVSEHILDGKSVSCVDFDSEGVAWIGSGSNLISYKRKEISTWEVGSYIRDLSVGPDGKIWIATKDRGLALFDDGKFTYFTMQNSGLPRDLIIDVEAAPDGTVWFSCSAHMLGGLMHFDGKKFDLFTPENSILNQNLVLDLKVDKLGNVFLSSEGTVGESKIFMIDNRGRWISLNDSGFYWIGALDFNSKSEAIVVDDHSLSSCIGCYTNAVHIYRKGQWNKLTADFDVDYFNRMFVDQRDYIWVQGSKQGDFHSYFVFDGHQWNRSPKKMIPDDGFIYSVKVDPYNNIWFCTNKGIYIINQS